MSVGDPALGAIVLLALALAFINGLHDASNAVSTTIATRSLSERTALAVAAVLNLLGGLLGIAGARAAAPAALDVLGLRGTAQDHAGDVRILLVATVCSALAWGVFTWRRGMPSSTWHAVLASAAGAAVALGFAVPWADEVLLVGTSILISPLVGAALTYGLVLGVVRISSRLGLRTPHLRVAQTVSAGAVAAGHGLHDIGIPLAVLAVAFATVPGAGLTPWWAAVLAVVALAAGTFAGGHRIIRTLATRLTDLSTAQGLAAETATAAVLYVATIGFGAPVSTSHTVTAGIVGSGLAIGPRSVRWPVVGRIVLTWVATPVVAALIAGVVATVIRALV